MKNVSHLMLFTCIAAFATMACEDDDGPAVLESDKNFAITAANANRAEVELGQLAAERGENSAVKEFGTHMVAEHTTALNELKTITDKKRIDLPTTIDNEHQQLKQRLSGLTGINFDTAYINSQVKDHRNVIGVFQTQSTAGQDKELRDYATKNLPHLNEHLTSAEEIQSALMQPANTSRRKD